MRRTSILAALVVAAAFAAPLAAGAQQGGPPPGGMRRGQGGAQMLMRGIELSAAQQARVDSVSERYRAQMMALRQSGSMDRQAMMALNTKRNAELRALLTAAQQKTFDKNVEELQARMRARMDSGGRAPR